MNSHGIAAAPVAPQMFGNAAREHMKKYGTTKEHLAKIAHKNHKHSVNNPKSQFRDEYSLDQILESPSVHEPLTKLQCCPTSDGSAAAILASEDFVKAHGLESKVAKQTFTMSRSGFLNFISRLLKWWALKWVQICLPLSKRILA